MGRNPLSSQVISNTAINDLQKEAQSKVVIPYQVRSYQTAVADARMQATMDVS